MGSPASGGWEKYHMADEQTKVHHKFVFQITL
jgi:hypothetical protein